QPALLQRQHRDGAGRRQEDDGRDRESAGALSPSELLVGTSPHPSRMLAHCERTSPHGRGYRASRTRNIASPRWERSKANAMSFRVRGSRRLSISIRETCLRQLACLVLVCALAARTIAAEGF